MSVRGRVASRTKRLLIAALSSVDVEHRDDYGDEDYFQLYEITDIKSSVIFICLRNDDESNGDERGREPDRLSFFIPHKVICVRAGALFR